MSEPDPERSSFEDVARALAEEVSGAIERLSEIDLDEIARVASVEGERARQWIDDPGRWLRERGGAGEHGPAPADRSTPERPTGDDPLRHAGPHPLDLPTPDQGVALAALDSGRWRVEPGTSALAVRGEGPGPSDALGLVRELRVRDWLSADREITLARRNALKRWLEGPAPPGGRTAGSGRPPSARGGRATGPPSCPMAHASRRAATATRRPRP